mgnify:CR=1 FL=1
MQAVQEQQIGMEDALESILDLHNAPPRWLCVACPHTVPTHQPSGQDDTMLRTSARARWRSEYRTYMATQASNRPAHAPKGG